MNPAMKKTTIEGLTSPAVANAGMQKANTSPVFKVDLRRSLRMHSTAAISVGAAVFLLVVIFGLTRKPLYMAKSLTYIEPLTRSMLSDGTTAIFDPSRYDSYLQQQMQTATRPDIMEAALAKLPAGTWQQPGETTQSAVARLQSALKVERVTTSYQLAISLSGPDPKATAATVNAVTEAYLAQGRHDEHLVTDQRLKLLSEERQRIQTELDQDRTEQASLGQVLGVANPVGDSANPYDMQLANVRGELQSARQAHDVAAAQLASLHNDGGARSAGMVASADDLIAGDPGLSSMKSTINQRKAVLSTQMAGLTPLNESYKRGQDEIADLDKTLNTMTTDLRDKAERRLEDRLGLELRRTGDIEGRLNAQLAQQTATATNAGPRLQRAAELAADLVRLTTRYATVDDAMRGMELEANGPGLAHLSVAATVPTAPEASRQKLLLLAALPLALLAGVMAAVFMRKRDPHVYTSRDVEEVLGFMPIGVLPARAEVSDVVVEEYLLRLAAGLESAYRVSEARSYVFSAASPTTDVSEFVEALSRKLRQLGLTALIVEASRLLEPLSAEDSAAEVVRPGSSHEGFATANMERLKSDHDLLLIDAPPLLHSAETEYAVRCADATILVAECGVTVRGELSQSAALLERLNVAGLGAVLDGVKLSFADARFRKAVAVLESRQEARPELRTHSAEAKSGRVPVAVPEAVPSVAYAEPVMATGPAAPEADLAGSLAAPSPHVVETPPAILIPEETIRPVAEEPAVQVPVVELPVAELPVAAEVPAAEVQVVQGKAQEIDAQPVLQAANPETDIFEAEPKKSWFEKVFARPGASEAMSVVPDADEVRDVEAQPAVASVHDVHPVAASAVPTAAPVETLLVASVPAAVESVIEPAAPAVKLIAEPVRELPQTVTPLAVLQPVLAPEHLAQNDAPEPPFVQAYEEPVFTRELPVEAPLAVAEFAEEPVHVAPVPAAPAYVEPAFVAPAEIAAPAPVIFREPAVMPARYAPAASVAAGLLAAREASARRSEIRAAYVPPVLPSTPSRFSEPLTTGRWEPVRPARTDFTTASGLHESAMAQSQTPAAERGVSRISGGRRAALQEQRDIDPRPVRTFASGVRVPPVPAPRNVNPLVDDGLQTRPGSLTRRWELLSRFDRGTEAMRPVDEDGEPVLAAQGRPSEQRSAR